jgi:beta-lactamase regulating signal transducer with metallopeptidase domain/predicted  nucleic acid-binding Zn-ribbon protein
MSVEFNSITAALAMTLLHFLWQGVTIALVAALLLRFARNARPALRYAIACSALAWCVLIPIGQFLFTLANEPNWTLLSSEAARESGPVFYQISQNQWHAFTAPVKPFLPNVLVIWLAGVLALSVRLALGMAWIHRTRHAAFLSQDAAMQSMVNRLAGLLQLRTKVELRLCDRISTPMAMGILKPVVLLPVALLSKLSPELLEALLAHELAHVKRHDYAVNLMQRVVETVLFYHPVVWWLSRVIRNERELIADDLAAEALGSKRRIALALSALSEWQPNQPLLASAAHGGQLMNRIRHLISPQTTSISWKAAVPALLLTLGGLTVLAKDQLPLAKSPETHSETSSHSISTETSSSTSTTITKGKLVISDKPSKQETFALVRAGEHGIMMSGELKHIDAIKQAQQTVPGDFVWVMQDGQAFIIRENSVLNEITAIWRESEVLSKDMDRMSRRMDMHADAMQKISMQMETQAQLAQAAAEDNQQNAQVQQQIVAVNQQIQTLEQMLGGPDNTAQTIEMKKLETLNKELSALETKADANERARADQFDSKMAALEAKMEQANVPMERLSEQMEALSEKIEVASAEADAKTHALINRAIRDGLAKPAQTR